jgi:RimJ/RimL family protein N-acetyltransferase
VRLSDGRAALLRDARPRDARALARLLDAVASESRSGLLMEPGQRTARDWRRAIIESSMHLRSAFLVAEMDGRLAADLAVQPAANPASQHVCIIGMSVAAPFRGVGLGGALLELALEWAAAWTYSKATLSVLGHNDAAVRFYERHGFIHEGRRVAQFIRAGQYSDEVLMARPLATS